jgi:hypothetical protein
MTGRDLDVFDHFGVGGEGRGNHGATAGGGRRCK